MALKIISASHSRERQNRLKKHLQALPFAGLFKDNLLLAFELTQINSDSLSCRIRWKQTGQFTQIVMPVHITGAQAHCFLTLGIRALLDTLGPDEAQQRDDIRMLNKNGADSAAIIQFMHSLSAHLPWDLYVRQQDGILDFGFEPKSEELAPALIRLDLDDLNQVYMERLAKDSFDANEALQEHLSDRVAHMVLHAMTNTEAERMIRGNDLLNLAGIDRKNTPSISVCMIVRDEADNLEHCLQSVTGLASEVIVVDTGSSDDTPAIAERMGAKVFYQPWCDDFSAARNASLARASGEWILILDADEVLNLSAHSKIRSIVSTKPQKGTVPVFQLRIRNLKAETPDVVEHFMPRLFPNQGLRFQGIIHEQIVPPPGLEANHYLLADQGLYISHYGYSQDALAAKSKALRNLKLLAKAIQAEPMNPFHYFNLGLAHYTAGDLESALSALEDAWSLLHGAKPMPDYAVPCFNHMILMMLELGQHEEVIQACGSISDYAQVRLTPEYWLNLGTAYNAAGKFKEAMDAFVKAASFREQGENRIIRDVSATTWKPLAGMANTLLLQGELYSALSYLKKALKISPHHPELLAAAARVEQQSSRLLVS